MNIALQDPVTTTENDSAHLGSSWIKAHLAQIAGSFRFCLNFIVFLLLGPFSAIVVLIALASLASEEKRERMREPARL
jgi:hypothetical protein